MNVAELTVQELRDLVREVVEDVLREQDPDFGLNVRPEVEERLRAQLAGPIETIDAATAFRDAGLTW